ncbi:MAG: threonylcarbamoyl-AMP synthase [Gemmatimonadaceae bacterium]|jgi:L-threonylcarbamoyladenylate synthase|nr:threonylcarbamoyl-AMP synthase [Gemmatimonadaceae bacterium]
MPEARGIPFWSPEEVGAAIPATLAHLQERGILAYPTETVYGFGTMIDRDAVEQLVHLKRRPPAKPFLLLISDTPMLARIGLHLTRSASMLAARHWPGPLTLVLPGGERRVPERLRGPEGGIAVRWTPHPGLQRLIGALGDPITSTSANLPGQPPAVSSGEIVAQWGAEVARGTIRLLDGGRLPPSPASTVVDCTGRVARVIRPGALSAATLRESVPDLVGDL